MNGNKHIELLGQLWKQCPELRFGQLLDFVVFKAEESAGNDTFFVSNGTYARVLQELIDEYKKD